MIIPTDIVAALAAVLLTAILAQQHALSKRISRLERSVLTLVIMLRDRGFRVPDPSDTDRILKSKDFDRI